MAESSTPDNASIDLNPGTVVIRDAYYGPKASQRSGLVLASEPSEGRIRVIPFSDKRVSSEAVEAPLSKLRKYTQKALPEWAPESVESVSEAQKAESGPQTQEESAASD